MINNYTTQTKIEKEGEQAYWDMVSRTANPYINTPKAQEWDNGWMAARNVVACNID